MFHLVRKEYWFTDEYILDKTLSWLHNSIKIILEDRYNSDLQLSWLVQLHIAQVMWVKDVKIPQWKDMWKKEEILEDDDLSDWWIWKW